MKVSNLKFEDNMRGLQQTYRKYLLHKTMYFKFSLLQITYNAASPLSFLKYTGKLTSNAYVKITLVSYTQGDIDKENSSKYCI